MKTTKEMDKKNLKPDKTRNIQFGEVRVTVRDRQSQMGTSNSSLVVIFLTEKEKKKKEERVICRQSADKL